MYHRAGFVYYLCITLCLKTIALLLTLSTGGQVIPRAEIRFRDYLPVLGCENLVNFILTLGGYRVINFIIATKDSYIMCNFGFLLNKISFAMAAVSISLNLLSFIFLLTSGLYSEHKQMQLFYFNLLAIVKHPILLFFVLFRMFLQPEASFVTCLAGHQLLEFAFGLSLISPVYPSLSCAIGSLAPMRHHDVLSGKMFTGIALGTFIAVLVLFLAFPLLAYGTRAGPVGPEAQPYRVCDPANLVPPAFTKSMMVFEIIFIGFTGVCLIVSLAGMIASCAKHNTWATSETDTRRDMEFFNLRLFFLCLLRLIFNLPWVLYRWGALPMPDLMLSILLLIAFVWGALNPIIFFFTDFRIRQKLTGCRGGGGGYK